MIFEKLLLPDRVFPTFRDVTPELLNERGIRFIFSDIDNTLATYDDPTPPENVRTWCRNMTENGVRVSFVSNNDAARVALFNRELGYIAYAKARKPLIRTLKKAMAEAGASGENSLLLGDQLLTDCAAGKRAGMTVFIVPPIKDKTSAFFRFKRWLEVPYMKKYCRLNGEDSQ